MNYKLLPEVRGLDEFPELLWKYTNRIRSFLLTSLIVLFIVLLLVFFFERETINPILGFGLIVVVGSIFAISAFVAMDCQYLAMRLHNIRKFEEQLKNALREEVFAKQLERKFDVFMCHNSDDKALIKKVGLQLMNRGLRPWLDEWEIRPGMPWQRLLEQKIDDIPAAAVFFGPSGIGPWQDLELEALIREFVTRKCPVIPVILPEVAQPPQLPILLKGMAWVDFRNEDPDPLEHLIWGITGKRPGNWSQ